MMMLATTQEIPNMHGKIDMDSFAEWRSLQLKMTDTTTKQQTNDLLSNSKKMPLVPRTPIMDS